MVLHGRDDPLAAPVESGRVRLVHLFFGTYYRAFIIRIGFEGTLYTIRIVIVIRNANEYFWAQIFEITAFRYSLILN